jgi:phage terminase small subunit
MTRMKPMRDLNPNQRRFVAEYVSVLPRNAKKAYMRAYPTCQESTAGRGAYVLLKNERVRAEIRRYEAQMEKALALKMDDIARDLALVASADARELSEWRVGACRYCYGENHRYQRTPAEMERDLAEYKIRREIEKRPDPLGLEFDMQGGLGYNPKRAPNLDCPECFGEGEGREVFKDTRHLSPAAARLYAGVKKTRDGMEIKTRSQDKAIELAGQAAGMFKTRTELSGPNGGPIPSVNGNVPLPTDPIEAAKLYQKLVGS